MSKLKVAVIVGSTREQRFSPVSAEWIAKVAAERSEFDVEILDLADYPMGFLWRHDNHDRTGRDRR